LVYSFRKSLRAFAQWFICESKGQSDCFITLIHFAAKTNTYSIFGCKEKAKCCRRQSKSCAKYDILVTIYTSAKGLVPHSPRRKKKPPLKKPLTPALSLTERRKDRLAE